MNENRPTESQPTESQPEPHEDVYVDADPGDTLTEHLTSRSTWLRLLFMVVFWILAYAAAMVAALIVVLGFLWVLITGDTNERLRQAGQGLASYLYQVIRYLTYNTEVRPFPVDSDWPSGEADVSRRRA